MFFVSASRTTGTSSPRSVSTATPMFTYFLRMISSAARSIDALNCGNAFSAAATTFTAIAVTVRLPPAASASFAYFFRSSSSAVTSARSCCVTWGIVRQADAQVLGGLPPHRAHRLPLDFAPAREIGQDGTGRRRRRRRGPRPRAAACACALTSSIEMRPSDPGARRRLRSRRQAPVPSAVPTAPPEPAASRRRPARRSGARRG